MKKLTDKINGRGPLVTFLIAVIGVSTSVIIMGFWVIKSNAELHEDIAILKIEVRHLTGAVESMKAEISQHTKDHE